MSARLLRSRRGSALPITITAMFLVVSATTGVLLITANALHVNNKQRSGAAAFNISESGAEMAALWLKDQPYPPTGTSPIEPFGGPQTLDEGTYRVTVTPDPDNPTSYLKTFVIASTGTVRGTTKKVEVVVKQASFGRYAYFTDKETSSISGGAIWWKAGEIVDGPVHSNNSNGSNFNINYNNSNAPIFLDMVTGSGSTINYNPSRPRNETTFRRIFLNGSKGFKLGVPEIPLPPTSDAQKNAAWGSTGGFPSSNGVYLRAGSNGGVYIRGDAAMELRLDASGNQEMVITQGSNVTTVTFDKFMQSTTVTGPVGTGSPTTAGSLGTGVIYCTGNITSLKGEVADNRVIGEDVELQTHFDSRIGAIKADPGQVEQVIMNLAVNARDAMPRGGRLEIRTEKACLAGGGAVKLVVRDTGAGMTPEVKERIFEPFFTTKELGKGTGLGLSTVYGIVKQSGGEIAVESEPGKGSVFTIHFPVSEEAAPEVSSQSAEAGLRLRERVTVLLVEDEAGVRRLVRRMLVERGYRVLEASDGKEALAIYERQRAPVDLVLTDIVMPNMNGNELADRLRALKPSLKILFMTGYSEEAVLKHKPCSAPILNKPFLAEALDRKVLEALGAHER